MLSQPILLRPNPTAGLLPLEMLGRRLLSIEGRLYHPTWLTRLMAPSRRSHADPIDQLSQLLSSLAERVDMPAQPASSQAHNQENIKGILPLQAWSNSLRRPFVTESGFATTWPDPKTSPTIFAEEENLSPQFGDKRLSEEDVPPVSPVHHDDHNRISHTKDEAFTQPQYVPDNLVNETAQSIKFNTGPQQVHGQDGEEFAMKDRTSNSLHDRLNVEDQIFPIPDPAAYANFSMQPAEVKSPSRAPVSVHLVSDPARLSGLLQSSLGAGVAPTIPKINPEASTLPDQALSLPSGLGSSFPLQEDKDSVLSPSSHDLLDPQMREEVDSLIEGHIERMMERLELAYLRMYGTSGK